MDTDLPQQHSTMIHIWPALHHSQRKHYSTSDEQQILPGQFDSCEIIGKELNFKNIALWSKLKQGIIRIIS